MDLLTQTRGRNVALLGAVVQLALAAVVLGLWMWTRSHLTLVTAIATGGGVLLWLMVALVFHVRRLEAMESLELDQLATGQAGMFDRTDQAQLRPMRARAAWVERWLAPAFTLVWAAFHAAVGQWALRGLLTASDADVPADSAAPALMFAVLLAFVGFLVSRYSTGLGRTPHCRQLRATGSYMLLSVLMIVALAAAMAIASRGGADSSAFDRHAALWAAAIQLLLAAELALNFVLDLYRPRSPGEEPHPSFDSRILGLMAEPARVGHSIAETLNYQFGFEVSKTWFYQIVSRSFVPLLLLGAAIMLAMTSVVIIEQGQQGVVLRWGRVQGQPLEAGLHLRLPWPIETVERFDTTRVHQALLGSAGYRTEAERRKMLVNGSELQLWSAEHGAFKERDFLVGSVPRTSAVGGVKPPDVDIIKLVVDVQYVIADARKFGFTYSDPHAVIESIASRAMTEYCAVATLDVAVEGADPARPQAIMTFGRQAAARELKRRIQAGVDAAGLGVRVVSTGFLAVHPPAQAAEAYEKLHETERGQAAQRHRAQGEANRTLSEVAGDPAVAVQLAFAIRAWQDLDAMRLMSPAQRREALDRQLAALDHENAQLREQIDLEKRLGKEQSDDATGAAALLARHAAHREALERLRDKPAELAAEIAASRALIEGAGGLFEQAAGSPARELAAAAAHRWKQELGAQEVVRTAQSEQECYEAAPELYMLDRRLDVYDQVLPNMVKYVLCVDPAKVQTWLNLERGAGGVMPGLNLEQGN
jgi:regulator of protease activity HflC (stomatin/prohibitin superfamily)